MIERSPSRRWADELAAWAIPEEILRQAPKPPWGFPTALFAVERAHIGALHRVALEALGDGGTVLDIGCGGGAASIPLFPPATELIAVDSLPEMAEVLTRAADAAGVPNTVVLGQWPEIAIKTPRADVVVCRNVVYNVADIVPFVNAVTEHSARRAIIELTEAHPSVPLAPLWMRFWDLPRPDGPSADLFVEVLRDIGIEPTIEREIRPSIKSQINPSEHLSFVRRRLCLDESHDEEIAAALAEDPHVEETTAVVVSWSP